MEAMIDILMLEDDNDDLGLIKRELKKLSIPFNARVASTAAQFLQELESKLPDIVLSDYKIPGYSGDAALADLRSFSKMIPFILVSGTVGEEKAVELMRRGVSDFVIKENLKRLVLVIEREISEYRDSIRSIENYNELLLYREIFRNSNDSICILDSDGVILSHNLADERLLGYNIEELRGKTPAIFFGEENFRKNLETARDQGNFSRQTEIFDKNGQKKTIRLNLIRISDTSGNVRFSCIKHDVTDIEAKTKELEILISNLPGAVYKSLADDEWTMLYVSDGIKKLTGYSPEELLNNTNMSYNEIIHIEEAEKDWSYIDRAIITGKHYQAEYRIVTKTGEIRWVLDKACRTGYDQNGVAITEGFLTDITALKTKEEEIREKSAQLQEINSVMINRELKMIELKKEINSLLKETGREEKYQT